MSFRISKDAFEYLAVQVGELDGLKKVRHVWEGAYERNLLARMDNILPFLPGTVRSILDVGSGLGGIDILLYRWFERNAHVTLLDGNEFDPMVEHHNIPFNSKKVAIDFLLDNGVQQKHTHFMEHDNLKPQPFDLIVSFKAWCFHIKPSVYLEFARRCCHARTRLILDIRKTEFWREEVGEHFEGQIIDDGEKHQRWVLNVKQSSLLSQVDGA
jgi:SAM-dependent methyltransferase